MPLDPRDKEAKIQELRERPGNTEAIVEHPSGSGLVFAVGRTEAPRHVDSGAVAQNPTNTISLFPGPSAGPGSCPAAANPCCTKMRSARSKPNWPQTRMGLGHIRPTRIYLQVQFNLRRILTHHTPPKGRFYLCIGLTGSRSGISRSSDTPTHLMKFCFIALHTIEPDGKVKPGPTLEDPGKVSIDSVRCFSLIPTLRTREEAWNTSMPCARGRA